VSRHYHGRRATLDWIDEAGTSQTLADDLTFASISAHVQDQETDIIIQLGKGENPQLTHVASHVVDLVDDLENSIVPTLQLRTADQGTIFLMLGYG
jgi:hypothetical protein